MNELDHNIPELIAQVTQWASCMNAEQYQVLLKAKEVLKVT